MQVFRNTGWPYYEKCLSIMFSSAACGSHVFHLAATTAVAPEKAKDGSSTAVNPPLPLTSSSFSVTAMDVDASTNHPLPLSSIKRPHSPAISESDKVSLVGYATSAGDLQVSTGYLPKNTCGSGSTCSHRSHQIQVSVSDIYHTCRSYLCILM